MAKLPLGISGSKKAGLPPGSLVHVGEQKTPNVDIRVMDYTEQRLEEHTGVEPAAYAAFRRSPTVTWIDVVGLHEPAVIEELGAAFGLHPLTQEDILNTHQRPKVEVFDDYVYVVVKMLDFRNGALLIEQVSLIIGKGYVLSFQEQPGDVFDGIRERLRTAKGRVRRSGADYLAYSLLDATVDSYFVILEQMGETAAELEDRVLADPQESVHREIHLLKRQLATLRKAVWPMREMTAAMQRTESEVLAPSTAVYLRDLYDHSVQVLDAVETLRDILAGLTDIYLSSLSNRMNAIMKVLTMIATIFIPLTFIAGIYGMNFEFMPELHWKWAYPAVLGIMLLVTVGMLGFFRRKRWL
ncbi:MAG: magnesium/cobalt transporter CorA [Thermoguttaceae bacterium]|nr:magnesium/cobalt transporter CorA [Thermoguttaceae bacterium]